MGAYIAAAAEEHRDRLAELREVCRTAVPDAGEAIKWGSPAYLHPEGTILFVFSVHKKHTNVTFTPSIRKHFDDQLTDWETGKGSVKIPHDKPLPGHLLTRMMQARWREFEEDGVNWM